jgi:hypothetical protein
MLLYLDTLIGFAVVMLVISLLITILTQFISALFNHRGSNLRWGLKTLFENIDPVVYPQLTANAETVASAVLRHCLISDSVFSDNDVAQWIAQRVPWLQRLLARFQLATAIRPDELADILRQTAAIPPRALSALSQAAQAQLKTEIDLLLEASGNAHTMAGNLEEWFGSMMDRVAQRFATYMRLWTVIIASTFAVVSGLNSISLLSELYSNGAFRSALVGTGQQVTATAITVLDPENALPAALTNALKQTLADTNVTSAPQPPDIQTTAQGIAWIQANVPEGQRAAAIDRFNTVSTAASQKLIQEGAQSAAKIISIASKSGADVLKFHWPPNWNFGYLLGVLATAALLSLGAPFWFNALKSMTNLRPILASKEQTKQP